MRAIGWGDLIGWGRDAGHAQYPTTISIEEGGVRVAAQHRKGRFFEFCVNWTEIIERPDMVTDAIKAVNEAMQAAERRGEL